MQPPLDRSPRHSQDPGYFIDPQIVPKTKDHSHSLVRAQAVQSVRNGVAQQAALEGIVGLEIVLGQWLDLDYSPAAQVVAAYVDDDADQPGPELVEVAQAIGPK